MMGYKQIVSAIALLVASLVSVQGEISIGSFPEDSKQDIAGDIVVISDKILEIRNFVYSGAAPDAFFWADSSANATRNGFILLQASKNCSDDILEFANGTNTITLEFPAGTSMNDILGGSLSVWCRTMFMNLGQVVVPDTLETSSLATEEDAPLSCADVVAKTWWQQLLDGANTMWTVINWLITPR